MECLKTSERIGTHKSKLLFQHIASPKETARGQLSQSVKAGADILYSYHCKA
jgi:hypothetical protein